MNEPDDFAAPFGPAEEERQRAIEALKADDTRWNVPEAALELGERRWKPDLVRVEDAALHLSLTPDVPGAWIRRMQAAVEHGLDVTFATATQSLDLDVLHAVQQLDARVSVVDLSRDPPRVARHRSVADFVAAERLYLDPDALKSLSRDRLASAQTTDNTSKKGRWFEEALCLVFSQVSWLTVDEHAYRNETEEIDLLLGCRAVGYVASLVGGPLAVATAKNEQTATGSSTVKYLKEQMANRKGRCKLGFLCSASTISSDARTEILRGTQGGDSVIVPVDLEALLDLINDADELDEKLEALIRAAVAE